MQDDRNAAPPLLMPGAGTREWHAQRVLILELVVTPPPAGERVDELPERLALSKASVGKAITALEQAGLVVRNGDVVRAAPAALYLEHLWPVAL